MQRGARHIWTCYNYWMKHIYVFILAVLLLGKVTLAADEDRLFQVHGIGQASCDEWLESRMDPADRRTLIHWILGYVTAYNEWVHDGRDVVGPRGAMEVMDLIFAQCRTFPDAGVVGAAGHTIEVLKARRMAEDLLHGN